jgi:hypothetical protein
MENLIPIPAPNMGVRPDLDPENLDDAALADAENVINRDGNLVVRPGFSTLGNNFSQRPMGYISVDHSDGTKRFIQATTAGWRNLAGGTWTDITGGALTGTPTDQQVFRTFPKAGATWTLGLNGANTMKKWDGVTATYADVAGTPPRARCMAVVFDRVVLGNLLSGGTISPVAIDVSADKDFDSGWGTQLVALLAETEGPINSMVEMGSLNAAILKTDAAYLLIAQGGIVPFRIQFVKAGISGPAAPLLASKLSDGSAAMLGLDALLSVFDGSTVTPMPYAIQKQIDNTYNQARINRGWMTYDSTRRELWIFYPLKGSDDPNGGVMVNMVTTQVYPFRFSTFKASAGGKFAAFTGITIGELTMPIGQITQSIGDLGSNNAARRLVIGDTGGQSYQDIGTTDGGAAIPFLWETPVRGQAERFMTIKRIRHRFKPSKASQTVTVKVGKRNEGGDIAYESGKSIDLVSTGRKATGHRNSAEFFSLRFEGNATQEVIYQGSAAYAVGRGRR